jgi:ELWxxDGT repeat protein
LSRLTRSSRLACEPLEARDQPAAYPADLTPVGDRVYFLSDDGVHGQELFVTDGTADGTRLVKDVNPGAADARILAPTPFGDRLAFVADDGEHGWELYVTDGTAAGTTLIDISYGPTMSFPTGLTVIDGNLYFAAVGAGTGRELWQSDGTVAGTRLVADINPGPASGNPSDIVRAGNRIYFAAEGTVRKGKKTVATGRELFETDGTAAGTRLVRDIVAGPGGSNPDFLTVVNDRPFFTAITPTLGTELWKSDGTAAGTALVRDIRSGSQSSTPFHLREHDGRLFFNAVTGSGTRLFRSNGSAAGTVAATDFAPGFTGTPFADFVTIDGVSFFTAFGPGGAIQQWRTDGTRAGTAFLKDVIPADVIAIGEVPRYWGVAAGGSFYFTPMDAAVGQELFVSDGTPAGTRVVRDIIPGPLSSGPGFMPIVAVGDRVFFTANDSVHGQEVWVTDGTAAGTRMVADIIPD